MTTFSYTTGNPSNLVGGATASMNDIQGPFTDLRTFVNGTNLDFSTNIAHGTRASYELVTYGAMWVTGAVAAGNYVQSVSGTQIQVAGAAVSTAPNLFSIVGTDHAITGLTTNLVLRVVLMTNATAPTGNWTCGLTQVNVAGGPGQFTIPSTGGFVGNQTTFTTPGLSSVTGQATTAFALPSNQNYGFTLVTSANQAANSIVGLTFNLYRQYT